MSTHESYCSQLDYESDMQAEALWERERERENDEPPARNRDERFESGRGQERHREDGGLRT